MVSITKEEQLITHERVNSSFDDVIVSLEVLIDESQRQECNLYKFTLHVVNSLNKLLTTFNVTKGFPSSKYDTSVKNLF